MHILISAMHMVGTFILAVAIALAFVGALLSPIFLGQFIAGRATPRIQHVIIAVLALVFVYGAGLAYVDFTSHTIAYWPMLPVFLPLYMGMGLYMGNSQKARKAEQERSLASWQNQLTADRKADAEPARLSADYREIAQLLQKLGRTEDAADEYRQGITLLAPTLGNHPSMAKYYNEYLGMLSSKKHADEIARITALRDALPKL